MLLEVKNVSYAYAMAGQAPISALTDVSFGLESGSFVGIMGKTGCGKTTLLHLIAGLIAPTKGNVLIDGHDVHVNGTQAAGSRVGIVFQHPERQLFETTVEKDVAFGLKHSGLPRNVVRERVAWALDLMGFDAENVRLQSPLALSGGEKRRVAIAGVLAMQPDILLFDEPIAGLDPMNREAFLQLAKRLVGEGRCVVMISHNADALAAYAERMIVLHEGRMLREGTAKEVFADVEMLADAGLATCAPARIARQLMARGMKLPSDIADYDALLGALISQHRGGGMA